MYSFLLSSFFCVVEVNTSPLVIKFFELLVYLPSCSSPVRVLIYDFFTLLSVGRQNIVLATALANKLPYIIDRPTIIFGANVTHPSPGEDFTPSIVAVVASMDWPQVTKYNALVSAQPHIQEITEDLYSTTLDAKRGVVHSGPIRELLISFKKSTGHKPYIMIFYRYELTINTFPPFLSLHF
ncbi:hypothetical protein L1887_33217 [Cichorium endivia]|nr:hypothetical protein L1887_33217 [Cichorium endivia]